MSNLKHIVGIYKTKIEYKIHSFSIDRYGILYSSLPAFRIELDTSEDIIIDSIKQLLESSCINIVKNGDNVCGKELLHFFGEKSWNALYRKSSYCELCVNTDYISLDFYEYSSNEKSLIYNDERTKKYDSKKLLEAIKEMLKLL